MRKGAQDRFVPPAAALIFGAEVGVPFADLSGCFGMPSLSMLVY